jgi:hypothetical protein
VILHLPEDAPWSALLLNGLTRLQALATPG